MNIFKSYKLKDLELKNKIVMPPMCTYSSTTEGFVQTFHNMHYGARAIGGTGLIILEATAIDPKGRISDHDLGIWSDAHIPALKALVKDCHNLGSKMGIQLAHAGRKCTAATDYTVAPSPLSYDDSYRMPKEITKEEIKSVISNFQKSAIRADEAGFDMIEIHGAHGYLIHEFLSPLSNHRTDAYGGSLQNRVRLLKEILAEVKKVWPSNKPISLRVSATDYLDGGLDGKEMVKIINEVKPFIDIVHVSTGGLLPAEIELFDGYQVKYADLIKKSCDIPTIAVGLINDFALGEEILLENKADLVAYGRQLLREPQFVINELYDKKYKYDFPVQYQRAYRYRSFENLNNL